MKNIKNGYLRTLPMAALLFICPIAQPIFAQNWEVGTTLGASLYNGDIDVTYKTAPNQVRFGGGLFVRRHINRWLGVRLQANVGTLFTDEKRFGSSQWRLERGFGFTTPVYEVALLPEIHPIRFGNLEPFAFGGVAFVGFNPTADYNEANQAATYLPAILIDKNAKFPRTTISIPMGGGFRWFINDRFAVGAEAGGRKTFSDYFDQVSASGGPKSKDFYFFGGVTFSYFFGDGGGFSGYWSSKNGVKGGGVSCPKF